MAMSRSSPPPTAETVANKIIANPPSPASYADSAPMSANVTSPIASTISAYLFIFEKSV